MHELGIATSIVDICAEHAGGERVAHVRLEIGRLTAVLADAIRFCFDVCAKGTVVEGAALEIIETPGEAICEDCGAETALHDLIGECRCGSSRLRVVAGQELKVRNMELA